ncbi:MAG: hypothetical protein ABIG95_05025 [Candidatus Woesearchaeota archaeon]
MTKELETLQRIESLLEILVKQKLSKELNKINSDKRISLLYQLTGVESREEIVKKTGFSAGKISSIWREWDNAGLIKKVGKTYVKVL